MMIKYPAAMRIGLTMLALTALLPASAETAAQIAPYNTQLFSLLLNQKSPVDGKNHYQKAFDLSFDAMLAQSALARGAKAGVPLKKRLLSGPQPDAVVVPDASGTRQYVRYEACQAHACEETKLVVLYAPASQAMFGRLHLDGKDEYLGHPSAAETALLDR